MAVKNVITIKVVVEPSRLLFDTTFGHLQPQATDIEKVVLGALMIDKDAFTVVSEIIKPETFYESRHEKIYEAVQSLNLQEKASLSIISAPKQPFQCQLLVVVGDQTLCR